MKSILNARISTTVFQKLLEYTEQSKKFFGQVSQEYFVEKSLKEILENKEKQNLLLSKSYDSRTIRLASLNARVDSNVFFDLQSFVIVCKQIKGKFSQERCVEEALELQLEKEIKDLEILKKNICETIKTTTLTLLEIEKRFSVAREGVESACIEKFDRNYFNIRFAKDLFKCKSKLESKFLSLLTSLGFVYSARIKLVKPFRYFVEYEGEFALREIHTHLECDWYHEEYRLSFEIDELWGHYRQIDADSLRDRVVTENNIHVYRFREFDIETRFEEVVDEMRRIVRSASCNEYVEDFKFKYEKNELDQKWREWRHLRATKRKNTRKKSLESLHVEKNA